MLRDNWRMSKFSRLLLWRFHNLEPTIASMDDTRDQGLLIALSVLRLSTGIVLLYSLFLGFVRHRPIALASPVEISAVVVAHVQPRRALILTLLTFAAFTYLLDELIVLFYYLYQDVPSSSAYQWRGVELADVLGFMAFSFIIIIGITKDKNGTDFWSRKRLKVGVILALVLDIAYLVLLLLSVRIFRSMYLLFRCNGIHLNSYLTYFSFISSERPNSPGIPERPNVPGIDLPNFLHFLTVDARILALFVLVIVLFKTATHYSAVHAPPTPSTGLVPAAAPVTHSTYGTFSDPSSAPKHAPNQNNDTTASGTKATEDYAGSHPSHSVAEGSAGGSQTKHDHAAGEPHVHVPIDPAVEDVPNPVTDDPAALNTSYAAVAAAHVDKERKADEGENADEGRNDAVIRPDEMTGVTDSPTAVAFPSSTRDDSSLRGVTFSADADNGSTKDATEGPGGVDKKRRRISSQNIKRIVRKITDIPRRKDSISSIGSAARAGEGQTTPKKTRMSREDSRVSGEGSLNREGSLNFGPAGDDSPAPSIGDSAKKAKTRKRMSLSLRRGSASGPKPEET
jgi:hypothetical protein